MSGTSLEWPELKGFAEEDMWCVRVCVCVCLCHVCVAPPPPQEKLVLGPVSMETWYPVPLFRGGMVHGPYFQWTLLPWFRNSGPRTEIS